MIKLLADENLDNTIIRGLLRRNPDKPTFPPSYHPQFENPALSSIPHPQTPDHRRAYTPSGASFLTLGTFAAMLVSPI